MQLSLQNIGIHFNSQWIFRAVSLDFHINDKVVFIGDNGSGKSTLLKICSGFLSPEEGELIVTKNGKTVEVVAPFISLSAPYIELIEEMTLLEFLEFHFTFKDKLIPISEMITRIGLNGKENQFIENFSSGMKQRVSLAQAFFADTPILLLDEPCSNMDEKGIELYNELLNQYTQNRIVVIASNDTKEYLTCNKKVFLSEYKP